jgi:putative FmdB family regulatory protein
MPTYEYRCDKCGQHLEVVQSFSDRPLRRHQQCGGDLSKVFHPRGVVFKGSGFYKTDSRPKASESKDGDGSSGKPAEKKKSEPAPAATTAGSSEAAD